MSINMSTDEMVSELSSCCPRCDKDIDPQSRACVNCGMLFNPHTLEYWWENKRIEAMNIYARESVSDADISRIAAESERNESGVDINKWLSIIDEDGPLAPLAKFVLAVSGIDYSHYESEEVIECEVCNDRFKESQTQEHHISYVHNFTITVCYSCHRKIHHDDGYYDDLQPQISREEAEKLRETGYTDSD